MARHLYIRKETKGLPIKKLEKLGSGSYGKVYECKIGKRRYAMKVIKNNDGFMDLTALREIDSLVSLKSAKRVAKLYEVIFNEDDVTLIMELGVDDLQNYVKQHVLSEEQVRQYAQQLCEAVYECVQHNIIHRDIKTYNVVITRKGIAKLIDFGFARSDTCIAELDTTLTNMMFTLWYRAPEVLLRHPYTEKADIWALAMTIAGLISDDGDALFRPKVRNRDLDKKSRRMTERKALLDEIFTNFGTPIEDAMTNSPNWDPEYDDIPVTSKARIFDYLAKRFPDVDPKLIDLLSWMFMIDPDDRPDIRQVLLHPYFTREDVPRLLNCQEKLFKRERIPPRPKYTDLSDYQEDRKRFIEWLYDAIYVQKISNRAVYFLTLQLYDMIKVPSTTYIGSSQGDPSEEDSNTQFNIYQAACMIIAVSLRGLKELPIEEYLWYFRLGPNPEDSEFLEELEDETEMIEMIEEAVIDIIIQLKGNLYMSTSWDFLFEFNYNEHPAVKVISEEVLAYLVETDLVYREKPSELAQLSIEYSEGIYFDDWRRIFGTRIEDSQPSISNSTNRDAYGEGKGFDPIKEEIVNEVKKEWSNSPKRNSGTKSVSVPR